MQVDLKKLSDDELVELQLDKNDWYVRHARRILQERGAEAGRARRRWPKWRSSTPTKRGGCGACGRCTSPAAFDEELIAARLGERQRLRAGLGDSACAGETEQPSDATLATVGRDGRGRSVAGRAALPGLGRCSGCRSTSAGTFWPACCAHAEDAGDHNLPLMYWYAAEPLAEVDAGPRAGSWRPTARFRSLLAFMVRRIAAIGTPEALDAAGRRSLAEPTKPDEQLTHAGRRSNEALKGRRQVPMPESWPAVSATLAKRDDAEVRAQATALALTFGDPAALRPMRERAGRSPGADRPQRQQALDALLAVQRSRSWPPTLQALVAEPALRAAALRGLAAYDDAEDARR